jgi:mycofactocin precursor
MCELIMVSSAAAEAGTSAADAVWPAAAQAVPPGGTDTVPPGGAEPLAADELLIEEISIDGMCGVY